MTYYLVKLVVTALLIVLISEIGKRYSLAGALLAATPLVSILAMTWMYIDTGSTDSAVAFSQRIVWLIAPTITFFLVFPLLVHKGAGFVLSMAAATVLTVCAYYSVIYALRKLGVAL